MIRKSEMMEEILGNLSEIVMGLQIIILTVLILILKRQYIITVFGMLFIIVLGIEKRASLFERILSMSVIFIVTVGFMLF